MKRFAIIGVAGFVAPRHLQAIKNIGGDLVVAHDTSDAVGVLDSYFPDCFFYTDEAEFCKAIEKNNVDYLVVCTPNYLHVEHCILGLQLGLDVICEKPLVLSLAELELLKNEEAKYNRKINTILQLRLHEPIQQIKSNIDKTKFYDGKLIYFTPRGKWYYQSWKGIEGKSGGIATNIGVHFFDMLCWYFGSSKNIEIIEKTAATAEGLLFFEQAKIHWQLSIDRHLAPTRKIILNQEEYIFTEGFHHLHTQSYQNIVDGKGFGIDDCFASTAIIETIRK